MLYRATVIKGSNLPALLGLKTLKGMNAIIDCRTDRVIIPKKAENVKIHFSADSRVLQLTQAPGGFLMLPCSPGTNANVNVNTGSIP